MSRRSLGIAWRNSLAPLRQEASASGFVSRANLRLVIEGLKVSEAELPDHELVEDLSFLVQQLLGPQASIGVPADGAAPRGAAAHIALCRLLALLSSFRNIRLHAPAANLILSALRCWTDSALDDAPGSAAPAPLTLSITGPTSAGTSTTDSTSTITGSGTTGAGLTAAGDAASSSSLQLEALAAVAALLPGHLGLLSEHERAAQLAALHSLVAPPRRTRASDVLEAQTLALNALAACCGSSSSSSRTAGGGSTPAAPGGLTSDEAAALLSATAALLHSCTARSRPVEDGAHSRLYTALLRALLAAISESKTAWVARAATLVEGLQRFFTYGVHAPAAGTAAPPPQAATPLPAGGGGGGRYCPPHLRRRESQADGGYSDSDASDTEHAGGSWGSGGGSGAGVDRFRSSRVRLGVLSCIQVMAKADPRVMHAHWTALLPVQAPLQQRPLTPHLLTVLLYDPLVKVRAMASTTLTTLVDGPAQRAILAVAEARSMSVRGAPVRGFMTLSLSLGQLLLSAHAGLLHSVASEASPVVLPGVLRALVALMTASPYERLPRELLPEVIQVLRTRWTALSASTAVPPGELGPIHAAYLACLAECFSTRQPVAGLAAYLQQPRSSNQEASACGGGGGTGGTGGPSESSTTGDVDAQGGSSSGASSGIASGTVAEDLVLELLAVGRNPAAAVVLHIEALGALKGLAAHYAFALPDGVWEDLRATAEMGLQGTPPSPRSGSRPRDGPPSRSFSLSSLSTASGNRTGDCSGHWATPRTPTPASIGQGQGGGGTGASASTSPEDKAAQLSVKLVSEYLAATARVCGVARPDPTGAGAAGDDDGGPPVQGGLPGAGVRSSQPQPRPGGQSLPANGHDGEEEEAGREEAREEARRVAVQRLAGVWQEAVALLVPAATGHVSYMVRSAGLTCLGELPEPVFSSLPPDLQQRLLGLLSEAAALDSVPAVRAAACKALGAAAAFPAVLAHADLSDGVMQALAGCLRDSVLSVRIAAGWAVANLCDAHRRRLEGSAQDSAAAGGSSGNPSADRTARDEGEQQQQQQHDELVRQRIQSHHLASTTRSPPGAAVTVPASRCQSRVDLEPHHYRQLARLCHAAITATQDADKVRANGIRAVGNLLAVMAPDMAAGLAGSGGGGRGREEGGRGGDGRGGRGGRDGGDRQGSWVEANRQPGTAAGGGHWVGGKRGGQADGSSQGWRATGTSGAAPGVVGSPSRADNSSSGGAGDGATVHLDTWLDTALTCLQSSLTTGGMKVQWNACYAALGLLRNGALMAHVRVAARTAPLLLLLVMLVRESANFKIRTHAAAALEALPTREAYCDVLPDALLVVANALEGLSSGGATAPPPLATKASKPAAPVTESGEAVGDGDGAAGEGRFPNYRYAAGLSAQLRATLLHLMALAQPPDARRVRDALARKADFLHTCLQDQLAEAVLPLRMLGASGSGSGAKGSWQGASTGLGPGPATAQQLASTVVVLPIDPFGLSGAGSGRGASPGSATSPGGLSGLLAGLEVVYASPAGSPSPPGPSPSRGGRQPAGAPWEASAGRGEASGIAGAAPRGAQDSRPSAAAGSRGGGPGNGTALVQQRPLRVVVPVAADAELGGGDEVHRALARAEALAASLRGFAALLTQLGPSCEPVLRDVQAALGALGRFAKPEVV